MSFRSFKLGGFAGSQRVLSLGIDNEGRLNAQLLKADALPGHLILGFGYQYRSMEGARFFSLCRGKPGFSMGEIKGSVRHVLRLCKGGSGIFYWCAGHQRREM